jgi:hypothetical protein
VTATKHAKTNNNMKFFTFLFYAFAVLPIIWEAVIISSPIRMSRKIKAMKDAKAKEYTTNQSAASVFLLTYAFWSIIGLMSTQWIGFAAILVLSLIPRGNFWFFRWVDSVISIAILVFIVINKYHLHIVVIDTIKHF